MLFRSYYATNRKQTEAVINKFSNLWQSLDDVQKVTVIGHSLSNVDMPYFERMANGLKKQGVEWEFSVHDKKDRERVSHFCRKMKVAKDSWTTFQL